MAPAECQEELQYWAASGLLLPPDDEIPRALKKLLKMPLHGQHAEDLQNYVEKNWKPNVTLADMTPLKEVKYDRFAFHIPFSLTSMPYACSKIGNDPENPEKLLDYLAPFFVHTAQAIRGLAGRLVLEIIPGDVTMVLGRIKKEDIKDRPEYFLQL